MYIINEETTPEAKQFRNWYGAFDGAYPDATVKMVKDKLLDIMSSTLSDSTEEHDLAVCYDSLPPLIKQKVDDLYKQYPIRESVVRESSNKVRYIVSIVSDKGNWLVSCRDEYSDKTYRFVYDNNGNQKKGALASDGTWLMDAFESAGFDKISKIPKNQLLGLIPDQYPFGGLFKVINYNYKVEHPEFFMVN